MQFFVGESFCWPVEPGDLGLQTGASNAGRAPVVPPLGAFHVPSRSHGMSRTSRVESVSSSSSKVKKLCVHAVLPSRRKLLGPSQCSMARSTAK